jgi:PKD repeat protein
VNNLKKKVLTMLLFIQYVIAALPLTNPVQGSTSPILKAEPQEYTAPVHYVNETFSVNVTLNNVEATMKLVGIHFRLGYNKSLLEVVNVTEGPFLTHFNQTPSPPYTFFISFVENDGLYGPHIVVGTLIYPNSTGGFPGPFPEGNGTIATIVFKQKYQPVLPLPAANCTLGFIESKLVDCVNGGIAHTTQDGYYEVLPLPAPTLSVDPAEYHAKKRGEIFGININLNNVSALWRLVGIHFRLKYDPSLLTVLSVAEGPFLGQFNQTPNPPHTFFISFVEKDGLFGPHILAGALIYPNSTGGFPGPFPEGNGTIATITFNVTGQTTVEPEPPANCTFEFIQMKFVNVLNKVLPSNTTSSFYQIPALLYPVPAFSYEPTVPSIGEVVLFDASESYDPDYQITNYSWNFGDGTTINTTETVISHIYDQPGKFDVTLTVTDIDRLSSNITKTVNVGYYKELAVNIDVGSLHFAGELADFYMLVSEFGKPINATSTKALLYYNGSVFADLTTVTDRISTGLYRIPYEIPANAEPGTYTLVVEAEYYSIKGTNLKSFLISSTLSGFVTDITQGIATVSNGLTEVKVNLTAINARLINIEGKIGIINSTLGTLKTDITTLNVTLTNLIVNSKREILANVTTSLNTLTVTLDAIDAKIVAVNGTVATISTTLGEANMKLGDVQSLATTALYVTSILSAIAVILAAAILIFIRKK